ncbi:unnamed protein product [Dibothriocephalus latus]|uniref:Uncharacterized protein n=1 Tax=Dibothriocephalus latus TaxID=60516 RepID=A0A3P7KZN8_DIBLA|nr:unnamed protein product [Dibothriocephalus latus]
MEISDGQNALAVPPHQPPDFPHATPMKQPSASSLGRALVTVRDSWYGGGSKLRRVARVAMDLNLKAVNWVLKRYFQLQSDNEMMQPNSSTTGSGPAPYWLQKTTYTRLSIADLIVVSTAPSAFICEDP